MHYIKSYASVETAVHSIPVTRAAKRGSQHIDIAVKGAKHVTVFAA